LLSWAKQRRAGSVGKAAAGLPIPENHIGAGLRERGGINLRMAISSSTETFAAASVKPEANRLLVIFCFGAIYLIWGSTFLAIRYAVEELPALYVVSFRHVCAGLILLVWALAKGARPTWEQIRASAVIGFLFSWWDMERCTGLRNLCRAGWRRC
jgi:hypothetical protein